MDGPEIRDDLQPYVAEHLGLTPSRAMSFRTAHSAEPLDIVLPENDWAQRGFVLLSTDAALGVGTPLAAGQSITVGPRAVVVMQST
ncbi:hypothetical protein [Streptomyces sp. 061-3]|uniref:hypothetical protein n=1 Tax=Streptomyces sp. 061-3 TaxID=2789268 RepID=UPI00398078E4